MWAVWDAGSVITMDMNAIAAGKTTIQNLTLWTLFDEKNGPVMELWWEGRGVSVTVKLCGVE